VLFRSWSEDGIVYNGYPALGPFIYPMNVARAGIYAGNRSANPPAHTVLVDYFTNLFGVPVGEDALQAPLNVTVVGTGSVDRALDLPSYGCDVVETLTAVDPAGWAFTGWTGDITSLQNPLPVTMNGLLNVTATFAPIPQHTLSVSTTPGGGAVTLDPAGGIYNVGTVVTVTPVPTLGWAFDNWSGDLSGTLNPETITIDADKSIAAAFSVAPDRILTANVTGLGTIVASPDLPAYPSGTIVDVTAVPDLGWQFDGWSGDLSGLANPDTLILDADRTLTATFSEIPTLLDSDDFNSCDLAAAWTFIDPFSDGGTATKIGRAHV